MPNYQCVRNVGVKTEATDVQLEIPIGQNIEEGTFA